MMNAVTRSSTDQINLVFEEFIHNPALVADTIAEVARRNPEAIEAVLRAVGVQVLGDVTAAAQLRAKKFPLVVGQPATEFEVPFGVLESDGKAIQLNLIPDYMRDSSGIPVEMTGNEAVAAVTALNGGLQYGNGYEKAIRTAVSRGEFRDGALILARWEDLLKLARERESKPTLAKMNDVIAGGHKSDSWCVSCTEEPSQSTAKPPGVSSVRLKDGIGGWAGKDCIGARGRVVLLRGFTNG